MSATRMNCALLAYVVLAILTLAVASRLPAPFAAPPASPIYAGGL